MSKLITLLSGALLATAVLSASAHTVYFTNNYSSKLFPYFTDWKGGGNVCSRSSVDTGQVNKGINTHCHSSDTKIDLYKGNSGKTIFRGKKVADGSHITVNSDGSYNIQ